MNKKTIFKKVAYFAGVAVVGTIFGISLQFAKAWTEPTVAPPGANVGAPITTGSASQTKAGNFGKTGSWILGDVPWGIGTLTVHNNSWDGVSNNNYGTVATGHGYFYGGLQSGGNTGWEAASGELYVQGNAMFKSGLDVGNAGGAYSYITLRDDESQNGVKYVHANSNVVGFLNGAGSWESYWDAWGNSWQGGTINTADVYLRSAGKWASQLSGLQLDTWQGNHYSGSDGAEYGTIFYDANNSGYYVDPNNTSRMNYGVYDNVYSYGWMQTPIFYDANNTGYYLDPNGTSRTNYTISDNTYTYGVENVSDIYIRNAGKWASEIGTAIDGYTFMINGYSNLLMGFGSIKGGRFSGELWNYTAGGSGNLICNTDAACANNCAMGGCNVNGSSAPHLITAYSIPVYNVTRAW